MKITWKLNEKTKIYEASIGSFVATIEVESDEAPEGNLAWCVNYNVGTQRFKSSGLILGNEETDLAHAQQACVAAVRSLDMQRFQQFSEMLNRVEHIQE